MKGIIWYQTQIMPTGPGDQLTKMDLWHSQIGNDAQESGGQKWARRQQICKQGEEALGDQGGSRSSWLKLEIWPGWGLTEKGYLLLDRLTSM